MKIIHLADLHFGKSISGQSLIEDQKDWISKVCAMVRSEKPAAVVIAGDVYDRAAPAEEAVALLDEMITGLLSADDHIRVFMVAGNHDSGIKLAFGSEILKKQRLHVVGTVSRELQHVTLDDEEGPVTFWLLPFTFPAAVQQVLGGETLRDYTSAIKALLALQPINPAVRNVLVAHQAVNWDGKSVEPGGSETMVGGVGSIDGAVFDVFDYVALGHIHKAQSVGRETMRYAGSPLCYHFDEAKFSVKGPVCVTLGPKGSVYTEVKPIAPLHPLREIRGTYAQIVSEEGNNLTSGEYVKVVITDRYLSPSISDALRAMFLGRESVALEIKSEYSELTAVRADGERVAERPLDQKFIDFWKARHGDTDPGEETVRLIRRLAEMMGNPGSTVDGDAEALVKFALEDK